MGKVHPSLSYLDRRRKEFIRIYGREPTDEELRTFIEYIELIKTAR